MKEMDKLRVLIPHWIKHNEEHAEEFCAWAERAGEASADILASVAAMSRVNELLASALGKLGGPLPYQFIQEEHDGNKTS